ncbi:hypothetical protein Q8G38_17925 [Halomonas venusta]|uniref:hypothetical protein n=1 Tax=Vreelandella venusta TaxID=44935 RepID=UPI00295F0186|nr:hypothetical protein [Halomonas venusta]MDW0361197.1 hypothetical protein [Halomonas venusta]
MTKWQGMREWRGRFGGLGGVIVRHSLHAVPEPPHCHSRVGLSGIHFDLGLQQPETPPIG